MTKSKVIAMCLSVASMFSSVVTMPVSAIRGITREQLNALSVEEISEKRRAQLGRLINLQEQGLETENTIIRSTIAEDREALIACLTHENLSSNLGGNAEGDVFTEQRAREILDIDLPWQDAQWNEDNVVTFRFTIVLKETNEPIGQYVISLCKNADQESVSYFIKQNSRDADMYALLRLDFGVELARAQMAFRDLLNVETPEGLSAAAEDA